MKEETLLDVIDRLIGSCYPYGSEHIDKERYNNLLLKIAVVDKLCEDIQDAGELYNDYKSSVLGIANKANQYLTKLRDRLNEIDYLPKPTSEIKEEE